MSRTRFQTEPTTTAPAGGVLPGVVGTPNDGDVVTWVDSNSQYEPMAAGAPGAHATTHSDGGTDEVVVTDLGGFPGGTTSFLRADGTFAAPSGGVGGGTIPTSGWTARNSIVYNDYLVPALLAVSIKDNATLNLRALTQPLGGLASAYTLIATLDLFQTQAASSSLAGVCLFDGTKYITFESLNQTTAPGRLRVVRWANATTASSVVAGPTADLVPGHFVTLKIVLDASNRTFYYYAAGAFTQFYQEAAASHLTESDIGICGASQVSNAGVQPNIKLIQWSLT